MTADKQSGTRLISRNGAIGHENINTFERQLIRHDIISLKWPSLLLANTILFLFFNIIFATYASVLVTVHFTLDGHPCTGSQTDKNLFEKTPRWLDCFYFCAQTMNTIA